MRLYGRHERCHMRETELCRTATIQTTGSPEDRIVKPAGELYRQDPSGLHQNTDKAEISGHPAAVGIFRLSDSAMDEYYSYIGRLRQ